MVDPQLRNAFTNRLDISGISGNQPFNPCLNARFRLEVPQAVKLLNEKGGLAQFDHATNVADWLHTVNATLAILRRPTLYSAGREARPLE